MLDCDALYLLRASLYFNTFVPPIYCLVADTVASDLAFGSARLSDVQSI